MATTTNFGWETPDDTDLVKDGALAMRTLGNAIDASFVDLKGGTTGQVLAKASNTDLDFTWATDASGIPATIFDAKGDLIVASAADTAARLAVGTNGQYLSADSTASTGLKWVTPAGGGKVLQVVQGTRTTNFTTSSAGTPTDIGLSVTITPSSNTSKVLILSCFDGSVEVAASGTTTTGTTYLLRSTTVIKGATFGYIGASAANRTFYLQSNFSVLDSPATTSATTYKCQVENGTSDLFTVNGSSGAPATIIAMEIGA